jgi:hypothetical protein
MLCVFSLAGRFFYLFPKKLLFLLGLSLGLGFCGGFFGLWRGLLGFGSRFAGLALGRGFGFWLRLGLRGLHSLRFGFGLAFSFRRGLGFGGLGLFGGGFWLGIGLRR